MIGVLFTLWIFVAEAPDNRIAFAAFDSYLRCYSFKEGLRHNATFMNPLLDMECKQDGLPDSPPPEPQD